MNMFVEEIDGGELTVAQEVSVSEPTFEPAADLASQSF
jgi:hypothetical protein